MGTRQEQGGQAEQQACQMLEQAGLTVIARNYRCRMGEIDLVCLDQNTLVFVEVRWRNSSAFGGAAASVTLKKQRRIIAAAKHFLAAHPRYHQHNCRFDVVAFDQIIARQAATPATASNWIKHAFFAE